MKRFCSICQAAREPWLLPPAQLSPFAAGPSRRPLSTPSTRIAPHTTAARDETPGRSFIFDIPELGTDGQPLRVRKWRRRSLRSQVQAKEEPTLQTREDDAGHAKAEGGVGGEAHGLRTRYRHRLSLKPAAGATTDVWDFMIRLAPALVHVSSDPSTESAASEAETESLDAAHLQSQVHLVLSPTRILHARRALSLPRNSPSTPSTPSTTSSPPSTAPTIKGRGVYITAHPAALAQLNGKIPHLGALARFPGVWVPPYLADQVRGQMCMRVMQELELLRRRTRGTRGGGEGCRGAQSGSGAAAGAVMRYLSEEEAASVRPPEAEGQVARGLGSTTEKVDRGDSPTTNALALLDLSGLRADESEARSLTGAISAEMTLPHSPKKLAPAASVPPLLPTLVPGPAESSIPIPTFHLASLFPATQHAELLSRLSECGIASDTGPHPSSSSSSSTIQTSPLRGRVVAVQLLPNATRAVRGSAMALVVALWRLKLFSGEGWREYTGTGPDQK